MIDQHVASGAGVTVAGIRTPIEQADQFGVIETDGRRQGHRRVPREAEGPGRAARRAGRGLRVDGQLHLHDRGADRRGHRRRRRRVLQPRPRRQHHPVHGRPRRGGASTTSPRNEVPGATDRDRGYWRDVGTLDAYYDAHMDLISVHPIFNLYNLEWPILTHPEPLPPAKFVFDEEDRRGHGARLDGVRGRRHLRRDRAALGAVARRAPALLRARRGLDPHAGRRGRPPAPSCAGRSSTRTCGSPRAPRSGSTPRRTASGFHVSAGGVVVVGKGEVVAA